MFPKGQDNTPIMGGSIGSNRIFDFFSKTAHESQSPRWDLYLINIATLARNAYSKGMSQSDLEAIVDKDADLYMVYIGAYTTFKRTIPANVIFYAPNYNVVPYAFMRDHTGNQQELDNLYNNLFKKIPISLTELTTVSATRKFICRTGTTLFPHKDLVNKIIKVYGGFRTAGSIGTVMISHCPLDFHIYKSIHNIQLLESYTASILSVSDFGQKLIKDVKIPFTSTTHRLFGDSLQLKPMLTGKDRTKLIDLAKTNNWAIKTDTEIVSDILFKFPQLTSTDLNQLKL